MIGDIHVEFKCSRCGETKSIKVDYWLSVDGNPNLQMETGRRRLEKEGWAFEEQKGKFIGRCNKCSGNAAKDGE